MLGVGFLVKEENRSCLGLTEEVAGQGSDPFEDWKSCAWFQDEESDDLLKEKANNNGRPAALN